MSVRVSLVAAWTAPSAALAGRSHGLSDQHTEMAGHWLDQAYERRGGRWQEHLQAQNRLQTSGRFALSNDSGCAYD